MACCLTAPSHYLNQCWLIIKSVVLWHSPESNFSKIVYNPNQWHVFGNYYHISQGPKAIIGPMMSRGATMWVPYDMIRISIQWSRYDTYLDTYLIIVKCQRDIASSMKADTCDQEHRAQPATAVNGVPTTTTTASWNKTGLCRVISEYLLQSNQKKK